MGFAVCGGLVVCGCAFEGVSWYSFRFSYRFAGVGLIVVFWLVIMRCFLGFGVVCWWVSYLLGVCFWGCWRCFWVWYCLFGFCVGVGVWNLICLLVCFSC